MLKFGQALHLNRPHLVEKGFLTPFITAAEYAQRRTRLLDLMAPNSLAIVGGNRVQFATPSVFYPFRQDPNFQYLTGFLEPDACLLLHKPKDSGPGVELMFVPEKEEFAEKWEGERTGTEQAKAVFGIDGVLPNTAVRDTVKSLVGAVSTVYADTDPTTTVRQGKFFNHELAPLVHSKLSRTPVTHLVQGLRMIKSESEIDCMRTACEISAAAYNQAYRQQFVSEHQLHAYLDFMFKQGGCESDAYLAVVAGGDHALTIHYVRNDDLLREGELVLVDAGGRFGGYCADISRTWPVNGRFTGPQRDLYEAVLATEEACIEQCTEQSGNSIYDLHRISEQQLKHNLKNAGMDLTARQVSMVYPHMIGHQLGLDVHDISVPGQSTTPLRSNQVVTIEPGIYVPYDDQFPKHFQGIGIRIEDNIVVGPTSYENLSEECLKDPEEIERV